MTSVGQRQSILEELRAIPRKSACTVCHWLDSREPAERAEWAEAFSDDSIPVTRIWEAMKARGYGLTDNPVRNHKRHVA